MANILITGASGLVGTKLSKALQEKGHSIRHVSRSAKPNSIVPVYQWNIDSGKIDPNGIKDVDHIVHLAGAPIVDKKWTVKRIDELIASRAKSAETLFQEVQRQGVQLQGFHSASGSNYYGALTTDKVFTESDPPGKDTIAHITTEWEKAVDQFRSITRTVKFRMGVVLSNEGGALPKLACPIKAGIGSPLGSGDQWVPWLHVDDVVRLFVRSIEDTAFNGSYNAVADKHVTNRELTHAIARCVNKKLWVPNAPGFVLRLMLGERAGLVLKGYRLSNEKLKAAGYKFKYPELASALEQEFN